MNDNRINRIAIKREGAAIEVQFWGWPAAAARLLGWAFVVLILGAIALSAYRLVMPMPSTTSPVLDGLYQA